MQQKEQTDESNVVNFLGATGDDNGADVVSDT